MKYISEVQASRLMKQVYLLKHEDKMGKTIETESDWLNLKAGDLVRTVIEDLTNPGIYLGLVVESYPEKDYATLLVGDKVEKYYYWGLEKISDSAV